MRASRESHGAPGYCRAVTLTMPSIFESRPRWSIEPWEIAVLVVAGLVILGLVATGVDVTVGPQSRWFYP